MHDAKEQEMGENMSTLQEVEGKQITCRKVG